MIGLLSSLLTGIETIGSYVIYGVETAINDVLGALVTAFNAILSLLPGMSSAPSIGHPQWLDWMAWFYPVGDLVAGLGVIVTLWVAFLAFRFALRWLRQV